MMLMGVGGGGVTEDKGLGQAGLQLLIKHSPRGPERKEGSRGPAKKLQYIRNPWPPSTASSCSGAQSLCLAGPSSGPGFLPA